MSADAVVLLSGGMDSAVVLAEMRHRGHRCVALSFDYGQRHRVELQAAAAVAGRLGAVEHRIATIDLRSIGGSALTSELAVPKDAPIPTGAARALHAESPHGVEIPITYVPARNTIFLSFALAVAESTGSRRLAIGVNAIDYSGYPDCRPEFVRAFETLANLATRDGVMSRERGERWLSIEAPLLELGKGEIVRRGVELGVDFSLTFSCYDPISSPTYPPYGVRACGRCDACRLRARGFADAGVVDAADAR
ncbi:MAG: 7-cyano-7-deazaguanine synthase QueC [Phycisphaerae bacterium]|nr:7-cyano-7-deazaguanine synthase QueC [Phycisphaerae bacterium]